MTGYWARRTLTSNDDRRRAHGALHAHHRAVAGVDALHFTRNQTVAHIVQATATVGFGNGRTEQAGFAHFAEDLRIGLLMTEGFQHAGRQLVIGELLSAVAHHALFFGQLLIE